MIRYVLAAQALKFFSASPMTRSLYRRLGNVVGARRRSARRIKPAYLERAAHQLKMLQAHGALFDDMRTLELGTGWLHWESLFLRLHCDIRATLFDVWDNRQFPAFMCAVAELKSRISKDDGIELPLGRKARILPLLDAVLAARRFEEAYGLLGFEYVVARKGSLGACPGERFDLVTSSDVLEHIEAGMLKAYVSDIARVLKPGGFSYHQVVPADHLSIYDRSAHGKQYLRYAEPTWKRVFDNAVQYQNRLQRSAFLAGFEAAGLELVSDEIAGRVDVSGLKIAPEFRRLPRDDLESTVFRILHRKAEAGSG